MVNSETVKEFLADVESAKAALFPILQAGALSGMCCSFSYGVSVGRTGLQLSLPFLSIK